MDITGLFHETYTAGSRYSMLCVDGFTRFRMFRVLKCNGDATAPLRDIIAMHVAPFGIQLRVVRSDGGAEVYGPFLSFLKDSGLEKGMHPPYPPVR